MATGGAVLTRLRLRALPRLHQHGNQVARLRIAQAATSCFSTLGLVTVATLVVTGSINTWYLVGSVPALWGEIPFMVRSAHDQEDEARGTAAGRAARIRYLPVTVRLVRSARSHAPPREEIRCA